MSCVSLGTVQAYLDNELPAERRTEIEHHLKSCGPCRHQLEQVSNNAAFVTDLLSKLTPEPQPIPAFVPPRNRTRSGAECQERIVQPAARWNRWSWRIVAPASLAFLLFLVYANLPETGSRVVTDDFQEWEALSPRTNPNEMFHNRQLIMVVEDARTGRKSTLVTSARTHDDQTSPTDDSIGEVSPSNGG